MSAPVIHYMGLDRCPRCTLAAVLVVAPDVHASWGDICSSCIETLDAAGIVDCPECTQDVFADGSSSNSEHEVGCPRAPVENPDAADIPIGVLEALAAVDAAEHAVVSEATVQISALPPRVRAAVEALLAAQRAHRVACKAEGLDEHHRGECTCDDEAGGIVCSWCMCHGYTRNVGGEAGAA